MRSGRFVAEAVAAHHSNEYAYAAATEFEHADGRIVVEATAAHHLDADMNAAATEFDHMDTTTRHPNENTNATAAATKEKAKRREVMSKSQEKQK